jgi:hypothetical protein
LGRFLSILALLSKFVSLLIFFLGRSTKNKRKKEVVNIIFNNNGHTFEGEIEHIEKDPNEFWPHLIQIDNTPLSKQLEGIKVGSIVPCESLTVEVS